MTTDRRRAIGMKFFVACLIGACLVGTGSLIIAALGDRSFAVEPNYYEKSLGWNDIAAQRGRNQLLGWNVTVSCSASSSGAARVPILVSVTDSAGTPLAGASVTGEAFPNARASARTQLAFDSAEGAGQFAATVPVVVPGSIHLRLRVTRGVDQFTTELDFHPAVPAPLAKGGAS